MQSFIKLIKSVGLATLLAGFLPFFIILTLINKYGINVPFMDQWEMVPLFQKLDAHTLHFGDLWAQHNEHRIFFPRSVLLIIDRLTHWNIAIEILLCILFASGSFFLIWVMIQKMRFSSMGRIAAVGLASLWFFSPIQTENWLWGWQIEWFMCIFATLLSVVALFKIMNAKRVNNTWFSLALISATVATFSLGSGVLIWFIGLAIMLLHKAQKRYVSLWSVWGLINIVAYYKGYEKPAGHPSLFVFLDKPIDYIRYVLAFVGRPLSSNLDMSVYVGATIVIILLAATLFIYKHNLLKRYSFWLAVAYYALVAGAVTGLSRVGFGVLSSMSGRYTAFSLLLYVALTIIMIGLITEKNLIFAKAMTTNSLIVTCVLFMLPAITTSYIFGLREMKQMSTMLSTIKDCTHQIEPTDSCLMMTYPDPQLVRVRLQYLKDNHYVEY